MRAVEKRNKNFLNNKKKHTLSLKFVQQSIILNERQNKQSVMQLLHMYFLRILLRF